MLYVFYIKHRAICLDFVTHLLDSHVDQMGSGVGTSLAPMRIAMATRHAGLLLGTLSYCTNTKLDINS